jgi:DNA helicase IV
MDIDNDAVGDALKKESPSNYPLRDEITGEVISDPDGLPITELESDDYLELGSSLSIEERSAGERAWRFGHVIVDEAQDLTPMQWRMIGRRARGHSMTIVGDVAQRTTGAAGTWDELLPEAFGEINRFELSTNYRSPEEVAPFASAVLGALDPTLTQPLSIRSSGHPVEVVELASASAVGTAAEAAALELVSRVEDGRVAIISADPIEVEHRQIRCLTPAQSKGMEFDGVVVVEPADIVERSHGLGLLYVSLTRTTDHLVILHSRPLPSELARV